MDAQTGVQIRREITFAQLDLRSTGNGGGGTGGNRVESHTAQTFEQAMDGGTKNGGQEKRI